MSYIVPVTDIAALKLTQNGPNSDIKPPLLVVDPERFYRSGEKKQLHKTM
ncbi:MAG: hypothetical protein SWQ30_08395 [Thermodesulfobacteriota bacterium]|nr:hypothetical protein [Thermodesulfobacteriota bacterium]